jgi:hypothetical protein
MTLATLANMDCNMNTQISHLVNKKAPLAHTKVTAIRDTLFVLLFQVVFRTTQCMRAWNY